MTYSGASVLDDVLGELAPGRLYLVTGGAASGKSAFALQFLSDGLGRGESVALLTSALPDDAKALARQLGLDMNAALRARRLLMLRYRLAMARPLGHVAAIERVVDDLRELLRPARPARIAIDSFTPFLSDGAATGLGIALLAECLESTGASTVLTFPEPLDDSYDRRLEPVVQRAAALLRLRRRSHGFDVEVVSRRTSAVRRVMLALQPGRGLVGAPEELAGDDALVDHSPRPLLLVHATPEPADDLVALLDRGNQVIVESAVDLERADYLARGEFGAVLVETDHNTLLTAQRLVARLSGASPASPLVIVVRFNIRSLDRARLIAAGADEVLTGDMGPDEFVQRLRAVVRRGRRTTTAAIVADGPPLTQALLTGGERRALTAGEMARVLGALTGADDIVPCAIVTLSLADPGSSPRGPRPLAELAIHAMRFATGDFATTTDERVVVCLIGAQRRGAGAFVDRVRERWVAAYPEALRAEVLTLPADAARARALFPAVEV